MFRENKWYSYRDIKELNCRYKFVRDLTASGMVYIIIAQYHDVDVQAWAHEDYDNVQRIMRSLTMTEGEEQ